MNKNIHQNVVFVEISFKMESNLFNLTVHMYSIMNVSNNGSKWKNIVLIVKLKSLTNKKLLFWTIKIDLSLYDHYTSIQNIFYNHFNLFIQNI